MSKKDDMWDWQDGDENGLIYECEHPLTTHGIFHCGVTRSTCLGQDYPDHNPCPDLGTIKRGVLKGYWKDMLENWQPA